jgi:hypothetical protein
MKIKQDVGGFMGYTARSFSSFMVPSVAQRGHPDGMDEALG